MPVSRLNSKEIKSLIAQGFDWLSPVLFRYEAETVALLREFFVQGAGQTELSVKYGKSSKQAVGSVVRRATEALLPYLAVDGPLMHVNIFLPMKRAEEVIQLEKNHFPDVKEKSVKLRRITADEWQPIYEVLAQSHLPNRLEMVSRYYVNGEEIVEIAREMGESKGSVQKAIFYITPNIQNMIVTKLAAVDVFLPEAVAKPILEESKRYPLINL